MQGVDYGVEIPVSKLLRGSVDEDSEVAAVLLVVQTQPDVISLHKSNL